MYKVSLGHKLLNNNLQTSIHKFAMTPCYDSTTKTSKRAITPYFKFIVELKIQTLKFNNGC